MVHSLLTLTAETASESGGVSPWIVGPGVFVFLLVLLIALVAFGGGREHS